MNRPTRIRRAMLTLYFIAALPFAAQAGVGNGYRQTMQIVFNGYSGAQAPTNFPALVVLGNGSAQGLFDYRQFLSPPNADLRFADAAGTELNYEIDTWNTNGTSYVWVQVPLLHNGAVISCFWGKVGVSVPGCSTNGATWTEGYVSVHHLGTASVAPDSAVHGYDGTVMNMGAENVATGMIGNALSFNPAPKTNGHVKLPSGYTTFTNGITVSAWVKFRTLGGQSMNRAVYRPIICLDIARPDIFPYAHLIWVGAIDDDVTKYNIAMWE